MGRINSIETMGALDGPGIRTIVFFQGCRLRCVYCHNPDMWNAGGGSEIEPSEVARIVERYKPYYGTLGGVTFSGGDPLMQPEFLLACLKECKARGIHTTLDTSGAGCGNYDEILSYCDLVILDIKHEDPEEYRRITGADISGYYEFKRALLRLGVPIWIKHVVVPGLTDGEEHLKALKREIYSFDNILKVELLPYHTMGITKYETLGIPYALDGVPEMEMAAIRTMQERLMRCGIDEKADLI